MNDRADNLPILSLWGRMLVALQGDITDDVAARLSDEVLARIHRSGTQGLVVDITGTWMIDSHLCSVLTTLAKAARLMGTPTIISGMSPESAQSLQTMGIELKSVRTALTVEQALEELGVDVRVDNSGASRERKRRKRAVHDDKVGHEGSHDAKKDGP